MITGGWATGSLPTLRPRRPIVVILALLVALLLWLVPLAALWALAAEGWTSLDWRQLRDPYLGRVVTFTFWQASLSTLLSVGLAIPTARALSRRSSFPGRNILLRLCSLSLVMPVIVAVLGIVSVFGRAGWLNQFLAWLPGDLSFSVYGLSGILIAHVFFNWPLATRVLLQALEQVPAEQWRLASQLGMRGWALFRFLEWPRLRRQLPGISVLVFLLCFSSFAVVMALGGGPKATTIELAIYQALRFDFDLPRATLLALLQLGFTLLLLLLSQRVEQPLPTLAGNRLAAVRFDGRSLTSRLADTLFIAMLAVFVLLPILAIILAGLNRHLGQLAADSQLWQATFNSVLIGLAAAITSCLAATVLILGSRAHGRHAPRSPYHGLLGTASSVLLGMPVLVVGTGLFLLLRPLADVFALAPYLLWLVNSMMTLPYTVRILRAPLLETGLRYDRLCDSLGVNGWTRWRLVEWPRLRQPMGLALAIATTLSLGDLGVIALFGSQEFVTLPLLIYQRMGSYQMDMAAATALWLLLLCLVLFWLLEKSVTFGKLKKR